MIGMLSDCVPICAYRRKSWLIIGWIVYVGLGFFLWVVSTPDIETITWAMFLMTCAYMMSDVGTF